MASTTSVTTNFSNSVTEMVNSVSTVVMYLNATLDSDKMNMNVSVNTIDKVNAKANAADVKTQYDAFMAQVTASAVSLGFVIF